MEPGEQWGEQGTGLKGKRAAPPEPLTPLAVGETTPLGPPTECLSLWGIPILGTPPADSASLAARLGAWGAAGRSGWPPLSLSIQLTAGGRGWSWAPGGAASCRGGGRPRQSQERQSTQGPRGGACVRRRNILDHGAFCLFSFKLNGSASGLLEEGRGASHPILCRCYLPLCL